jgi:hypothetical protein
MRLLRTVLLAAVLLVSGTGAAQPVATAGEAARQAMREAMMKQAAMPVQRPVLPTMTKPDDRGPAPHQQMPPGKARSDAALQKAMRSGMWAADAMRAEWANRAAYGSAWTTMWQMSGDSMCAPMMQRSQGMNPGGGMMPGSGYGGGWGMGPGGMGPGMGGGGMGGGMGGGGMGGWGMGAAPTLNPGAMQLKPGGR